MMLHFDLLCSLGLGQGLTSLPSEEVLPSSSLEKAMSSSPEREATGETPTVSRREEEGAERCASLRKSRVCVSVFVKRVVCLL